MAKATAKATFLIKSEPSVYSFDQLLADGSTTWDGVRNYEARNNLRAMKKGDNLLYYHSNEGKEIVGLARVARAAYQDPKTDGDWSAIEVTPLKKLEGAGDPRAGQGPSAPLEDGAREEIERISVVPVTDAELAAVLALAQTKL